MKNKKKQEKKLLMIFKILICCQFILFSQALLSQIKCEAKYEINGQEICAPEISGMNEFISSNLPKWKEFGLSRFTAEESPIAFYMNLSELLELGESKNLQEFPDFTKISATPKDLIDDWDNKLLTDLSDNYNLSLEEINEVINSHDKDMVSKLFILNNSHFRPFDNSLGFHSLQKEGGIWFASSMVMFNHNEIIYRLYHFKVFDQPDIFIDARIESISFLEKFIEANSSDNIKTTSNTYEAMNNLIGKDSIDENEICASNMKLGLKESYGIEINQKDAETYCRCIFEGLAAKDYGLTLNKSAKEQMLEKDSPVYNEVAMTCLKPILISMGIIDKEETSEDDVYGNKSVSEVKLLEDFDETLKLKIKIGGIEKYFLFDTGASNLVIDEKLEAELLKKNVIRQEDYKGTTLVSFADNSSEECRVVNLSQIEIGGYTLKNVETIILKGGALLCGQSLLNKFKKYNFDSNRNVLILEKNK